VNSIHPDKPLDLEEQGLSWPELREVRTVRSFERVEGFVFRNFNIDSTVDGGGYRVRGGSVPPGLFRALDEKPVLDRDFNEADGADFGFETSLILSHELWLTRFRGDPAIVGQSVLLNGRKLTVVGVMRFGFSFPFRQQIWLPYAPNPNLLPTNRFFMAMGLLRPEASLAATAAELRDVTGRLLAAHPDAMKDMSKRTDTHWAPWTVIDGNNQKAARIAFLTHVVKELEASVPQDFPEADAEIMAMATQSLGYSPGG